jgi:prepilin-type processing-associated H-X9-DG protein
MEEQDLLNLVDQNAHWRDASNRAALERPLPFLRCPSGNPTEWTEYGAKIDASRISQNNLRCHYVGIFGARPGPNKEAGQETDGCAPAGGGRGGGTFTWPQSSYFQRFCSKGGNSNASSGGPAINGVIFPRSNIGFGAITDGTSKTMMFGEMSWDVGVQEMWMIGSTTHTHDPVNDSYGVPQNAKNVRYGINVKKYSTSENPYSPPYTSSIRDDPASEYAPLTETSLGSYHPGGTHVGMADGSAAFLRDDVDVEGVLRRMASRASEDIYESQL